MKIKIAQCLIGICWTGLLAFIFISIQRCNDYDDEFRQRIKELERMEAEVYSDKSKFIKVGLPKDQKFIGFVLTRAQIAETLNEHIEYIEYDDILFIDNDARLTDELCQWYVDEINAIDAFKYHDHSSFDQERDQEYDIKDKMLEKCQEIYNTLSTETKLYIDAMQETK